MPEMPDKFTKAELAARLRQALYDLDKVADEIIITYLGEEKESGQEKSDH
jgi:hypothetical protein